MIIIKAIIQFIFKIVGILLIILGQGLVLLAVISGWLMNIITAIFFFGAIAMSFSDMALGQKITIWVIAIIVGAIATNIYTLPQRLVNTGTYLIDYEF
ncbi:hypothetical protein SAMN04488168_14724 [Bacillus sp. 491mf]|uniref:hypothetical protein n=1 Tax=Bacillus TaxID=1386 RepID=UPI000553597E|nr:MULTISPECIES: hypothetical protein [unclassified Bacillus (in: firmicutes)]SFD51884.1 hypothetical protein SAMN04488168_14724 [Bacillus sp. 491mf]